MPQSPPGRKELPLRALSFLFDRRCKSLLASTTHPVPHSAPLQSSVVTGPMRRAIVDFRRADSLSLSVARARNYPMCKNSTRYDRTRNFGPKNLSSARHYDQIRFRFHTWGNSGLEPYSGSENQLSTNTRPTSWGLAIMEGCNGALCRTGHIVETDSDLHRRSNRKDPARRRSAFRPGGDCGIHRVAFVQCRSSGA